MVILRSQNKITDFFMILAWASLFKTTLHQKTISYTVEKLDISRIWLGGGGKKREILDEFGNLTLCAPRSSIICDPYTLRNEQKIH